ncbi:hypothetical protein FHG87_008782 [Trinorchestia longiramus]|nr:hypothetical protein FHG87_008782 [Trinorchestia longiramus]
MFKHLKILNSGRQGNEESVSEKTTDLEKKRKAIEGNLEMFPSHIKIIVSSETSSIEPNRNNKMREKERERENGSKRREEKVREREREGKNNRERE